VPANRWTKERRRKDRFSFVTSLQYRMRRDTKWEGSGRTANMSAAGILIVADRAFQPGAQIEISLDWPGLYHNAERMRLVVSGAVVRSQGRRTALRILQHEFLEVPADPGLRRREIRNPPLPADKHVRHQGPVLQ
jgi:c-di-GMP-binding flagellar brake protein YcgR